MSETYIDSDGSKLRVNRFGGSVFYFNSKNRLHRLDGPATEYSNGTKFWYQNDQYHRLDGPAIECANGTKYWFVDSRQVEPLFLVAHWLERGQCCWFDESTQTLCFAGP